MGLLRLANQMLAHGRHHSLVHRRWISAGELASMLLISFNSSIVELLANEYPKTDPRSIKAARVQLLSATALVKQGDSSTEISVEDVHAAWRMEYDSRLHETAFDEMADPGEQCDGELPSWTRDRLSVERDPEFNVPTVSAHEAATRLKDKPKK